jgi:hypothetical protein
MTHSNTQPAPERSPHVRRLNHDQLLAINSRAQVRHFAAQLLLQAAYMNYPNIFAAPAPEKPAESAASNPWANVVAADAERQHGSTLADKHLAEVVSLQQERDRRAAAMMLAPAETADMNPELANIAREGVAKVFHIGEQIVHVAERADDVQEAA